MARSGDSRNSEDVPVASVALLIERMVGLRQAAADALRTGATGRAAAILERAAAVERRLLARMTGRPSKV